jgi:hypothetical protein
MEINNPDKVGTDAMKVFVIVAVSVFLFGYLTSCSMSSNLSHNKPVGYQKIHQYTCPAYQ